MQCENQGVHHDEEQHEIVEYRRLDDRKNPKPGLSRNIKTTKCFLGHDFPRLPVTGDLVSSSVFLAELSVPLHPPPFRLKLSSDMLMPKLKIVN